MMSNTMFPEHVVEQLSAIKSNIPSFQFEKDAMIFYMTHLLNINTLASTVLARVRPSDV